MRRPCDPKALKVAPSRLMSGLPLKPAALVFAQEDLTGREERPDAAIEEHLTAAEHELVVARGGAAAATEENGIRSPVVEPGFRLPGRRATRGRFLWSSGFSLLSENEL